MDSLSLFRKIILLNELGGDSSHAYRFSDPDGTNRGKSGWSFGLCQFDVANNPAATLCLRECEFTTDEIEGLRRQMIDIAAMNRKLACSKAIVDKWDDRQLAECLTVPLALCQKSGIRFADDEAPLHVADYHNQFYMSRGGKLHQHLLGLGRPVAARDILAFKLGKTPWGQKRPDDVRRRFDNIAKVFREEVRP